MGTTTRLLPPRGGCSQCPRPQSSDAPPDRLQQPGTEAGVADLLQGIRCHILRTKASWSRHWLGLSPNGCIVVVPDDSFHTYRDDAHATSALLIMWLFCILRFQKILTILLTRRIEWGGLYCPCKAVHVLLIARSLAVLRSTRENI